MNKCKIFILLTILVVLVSLSLYAQKSNINFEHISIEHGLSSNLITFIFQDSKGFMWFGTEDGLNKYDGYNFTVYKHDPNNPNSLSQNHVLSICEDQKGILWVGTWYGGLNKFDRMKGTFTHYTHGPNNPNSLSADIVITIYEDKSGVLWVGTWYGGLNKFDRTKGTFTRYTHDANNPKSLSGNIVTTIYEDKSGVLWIGTAYGGLNKFDRTKGTFTHYTHGPNNPNSLSGNDINSIYEDKSGVFWVGTYYSGLNEYDRTTGTFKHYIHEPNDPNSLSDNNVTKIYEDRMGVLWVGTWFGGLNKFDRTKGTFTHYTNDPNNPNSLSLDRKISIYEDQSGILWIGTDGGGLNKYDRTKVAFLHYKHDPNNSNSLSENYVTSIYADKAGVLWVGTWSGGLNKFDRAKGTFTHYKHDPNDSNSLSDNNVESIYEDKSGVLWIGTRDGGLNKFDRTTETFTHYKHDPNNPNSLSDYRVTSICEDQDSVLWVGTWSGGLNKFDSRLIQEEKEKFIRFHKQTTMYSPDLFNSIKLLKESNRLIASKLKVGDFENRTQIFELLEETRVLIVSTGEGIHEFQERILEFLMLDYGWIENEKEEIIWNMEYEKTKYAGGDERNRIQVGLDTLKPGKYKLRYLSNDKHSYGKWIDLGPPDFPQLWGVQLFSITEKEEESINKNLNKFIEPNSISLNNISQIYEDKSGTLWIATRGGGLNKFDRVRNTFKLYWHDPNNLNSLNDNQVRSIYEDKTGVLWFGTHSGLNKFDPRLNQGENENFIHFTEKDGLSNNMIYGILEDDKGNLWLSTNKGLSNFILGPDHQSQFKNYNVRDGLQGFTFNSGAYFKSRGGEMFFGGPNGFNAFYPSSSINPHIPEIIITDFQLFNKPVEISSDDSPLRKHITETNEIVLSYEENVFSFEFAALSYAAPEKNKYAYMMEGFDKDWIYTDASRRWATYTHLDPGDYVFRVKGSNNDNIWNEVGTSIKIIITPPWWKTWWAYSVYVLFGLSLLYSIRHYEQKRTQLKNQVELDKVKLQEREETDRLKSHFFANISHEFRTPLTLILGPSESIITRTSEDDTKKLAGSIKRNANRLLGLINQLLDLSKLEAGELKLKASIGNIVSFTKGITMSFESIAERKDITLKVKTTNDEIEIYFDRDKMAKIITNLLSNAFKFTAEGGEITVNIKPSSFLLLAKGELKGGSVEIIVRDTGIGISKEEIPKLFDRFYQVDSSQTREHEGTGIGLALTKELVELHHGSINVDSKKGDPDLVGTGWTEFTIELPLGREHLSSDEIVELVEPVEEETIVNEEEYLSPTSGIQTEMSNEIVNDKTIILVVEDNADVREYIKDSLGEEHQVEEAVNGEQGVRKAEKIIPDLIISDIMMPKMDGYELTRKLKNDEKTSHIPIILLTAKSEQESKLEGLETGADAYLTKPFNTKELQIRIKNLINIRKKLQEKFGKVEYAPSRGDERKASSIDEQFMYRVMEVIDEHISEEKFNMEEFGKEVGMSRMQLHRKLKALTGKSAGLFIRAIRLGRARKMIKDKRGNISEIAYSVGFGSPAYFTRCFKEEYGYPPSDLIN